MCGRCIHSERDYQTFETSIRNHPNAAGTQGLCHQSSDGNVIFAGYKEDNNFFGHVLVHETSHEFVHRYLSTARTPPWLDEGMSDWLADVIVKGDSISRQQKDSAWLVRQRETKFNLVQVVSHFQPHWVLCQKFPTMIMRLRMHWRSADPFDYWPPSPRALETTVDQNV